MAIFNGTEDNDTANAAIGELIGFVPGTDAELGDLIGDNIDGGGGDDFIFAGNGDDTIFGGEGFDRLNGAEGNDTIYAYLAVNAYSSLTGGEILGNIGNDVLYGSNGGDILDGGVGNDRLTGGGGVDQLVGGDGNDFFFFSAGDVAAGEIIDGGADGVDTIFASSDVDFRAAANIAGMSSISLFFGTATFTATQIRTGFESASTFLEFVPQLSGATLRIEMGSDTTGTFDFEVDADSLHPDDTVLIVGDSSSEIITSKVFSMGFVGPVPMNRLLGQGGNDRLTGDGLLSGGFGNDILQGGTADDTLIGGDGLDTMSWAYATFAIVFTLPEGGEGLGPNLPELGEDYFSGIENLTGGAAGDSIAGNSGANVLAGLGGNDVLTGGAGKDTLRGGAGNDTLRGGAGNDLMRGNSGADAFNGEAGIDTASYRSSLLGVVAALDGSLAGINDALGDTFSGIESLVGTNVVGAGDTLRGNAGANTLNGLAGDDTIEGLAGNDALRGGAGADTMTGAAGGDRYIYDAASEGGDTVIGFSSAAAGNDDAFWFSSAAFGGLPVGALAAFRFQSSAANVAGNANIRFFHETDTGILRHDADGSGAGAAVAIATLTGLPALALSDFTIF